MKIMTKEWFKNLEYHDLIIILEPNSNKKIPFIFMNGGTESIAKEDLQTVKTEFNITDKENEINFIMLPDTFDLEFDFLGDGKVINENTCKNDFLIQYLNRLRVISYIPDEIINLVKDKRMLALGYAEEEVKKEILIYIRSKYRKALELHNKCNEALVKAEKGLTIHKQLKKHYIHSLSLLFDGVKITNIEKFKDGIYLTLDDYITVVFHGAKVIEEEADIEDSCVCEIELYKNLGGYELHFLVMKRNESLIAHYYYVTYAFKDLKFKT